MRKLNHFHSISSFLYPNLFSNSNNHLLSFFKSLSAISHTHIPFLNSPNRYSLDKVPFEELQARYYLPIPSFSPTLRYRTPFHPSPFQFPLLFGLNKGLAKGKLSFFKNSLRGILFEMVWQKSALSSHTQ